MKKLYNLFAFVIAFFCSFSSAAQDKTDGLYLKNTTVEELKQTYKQYGYKDYIYMPDWEYPAIFLETLPKDFSKISDPNERNKLFLMILGPLTLKLNQEILEEREEILSIAKEFKTNKELSETQEKIIEAKAEKYDIFTRLQGYRRYEYILKQLKLKIDIVSPSILMALAAIDTNWGTSRSAREANNFYKQYNWYNDEGLKPENEADDSYRIKIFKSIYDSMKEYALKVNSNINYEQLRLLRAEIRDRDKPINGRNISHLMVFDDHVENIAGLINYTITFYELTNWDEAKLKVVTKV